MFELAPVQITTATLLNCTREALLLNPNLEVAKNNLNWMATPKSESARRLAADAELLASLHHAEANRYQECADASRQALRLRPDFPLARNNLSRVMAKSGAGGAIQ